MIGYREARNKLMEEALLTQPVNKKLADCLGSVVASDILSPLDVPSFRNSAMDGYAFRYEDLRKNTDLKIFREDIPAGIAELPALSVREAFRIFTGAPIPEGADTVVAQELVRVENGLLKIDKEIKQGANIRETGSQTRKGDLVLKKFAKITAEMIGFLATLGLAELPVYPQPKVGIIVTGKELTSLGEPLKKHHIYESNSVFLNAALKELGINPVFSLTADDDKEVLKKMVEENYSKVDLLLFTGGISVGNYDYVKAVLEELGIREYFYKVRQKPGKPLYFGKVGATLVLALPGNPAAVVSAFHIYVKPLLQGIMGKSPFEAQSEAILLNDYHKKTELTYFIKVFVKDHKVRILPNQLSYQMDAFGQANALAILRENQEYFSIGEKVEIIKFS